MHRKTFGIVLLISGALTAPASATSLEAFSGVVAGLNECSGGGPPRECTRSSAASVSESATPATESAIAVCPAASTISSRARGL
jgi:hypothetical protein